MKKMAYRFTNTDKWNDSWFCELRITQKALFLYLCDQCDIAGFLELNMKKISFDLGIGKQEAEGAFRGMDGKIIYSKDRKYIFIRNFIKHQKNYPLNENNNAHKGIIKRLEENIELFEFQSINEFFISPSQAPDKPLSRGIGKGKGNGKEEGVTGGEVNWRTDFETYKNELREAYRSVLDDKEFIAQCEKYHPGVDIPLSLEKSCVEYWVTESGWKKKKQSKTMHPDWKKTFINALNLKSNLVYGR